MEWEKFNKSEALAQKIRALNSHRAIMIRDFKEFRGTSQYHLSILQSLQGSSVPIVLFNEVFGIDNFYDEYMKKLGELIEKLEKEFKQA